MNESCIAINLKECTVCIDLGKCLIQFADDHNVSLFVLIGMMEVNKARFREMLDSRKGD